MINFNCRIACNLLILQCCWYNPIKHPHPAHKAVCVVRLCVRCAFHRVRASARKHLYSSVDINLMSAQAGRVVLSYTYNTERGGVRARLLNAYYIN